MERGYIGLHELDGGCLTGLRHGLGLIGRERQCLLAQDMLACLGAFDRPLGVQLVRKRDVDGFDLVIVQQRVVTVIRVRRAEGVVVVGRSRLAGDGHEARRFASIYGGQHGLLGDA
jgi:hypothetical protein